MSECAPNIEMDFHAAMEALADGVIANPESFHVARMLLKFGAAQAKK